MNIVLSSPVRPQSDASQIDAMLCDFGLTQACHNIQHFGQTCIVTCRALG